MSVGSWGGVRRDSRDLLISHREVSQGAETESSYKTRMGWKNGGRGRLEPSVCSPDLDVFLTLIHYHNSVSMFDAHGFTHGGGGSPVRWPFADTVVGSIGCKYLIIILMMGLFCGTINVNKCQSCILHEDSLNYPPKTLTRPCPLSSWTPDRFKEEFKNNRNFTPLPMEALVTCSNPLICSGVSWTERIA